jgi:hypothetical protein
MDRPTSSRSGAEDDGDVVAVVVPLQSGHTAANMTTAPARRLEYILGR